MAIEKEYLLSLKKSAEQQYAQALATANQASGAIKVIDALLEQLNRKEDENDTVQSS
jgi:hypothetical protein